MSPRFSLNKEDTNKILQVFLWSTASAGITALIGLISSVQVDPAYAIFIPVINTSLVAIKKYVEDRTL